MTLRLYKELLAELERDAKEQDVSHSKYICDTLDDRHVGAGAGVQLTIALAGVVLWEAWLDARAALAPIVSQRSIRARIIVTEMLLLGVTGGNVLD